MPLDEEGAKWSCEPCIRGHRSSKCQHFDRLMMKVPKAGRPLAKCPHPKGTCSCKKTYAVMVRIPKGSTCMCRPLYEVPIEDETDNAPTRSTTTPVTIAPAITPSSVAPTPPPAIGKVQKTGRRQSNLQAAPENIARALESIAKAENERSDNGTSNDLPSYASQNQSFPTPYGPLAHQQPTVIQGQAHDISASTAPESKSCCSGKAAAKPTQPPPEQPPEQPAQQGSCCGKQGPKLEQHAASEPRPEANGINHRATANGSTANELPYPPFPAPTVPTWQNFHAPGHGNLVQPFPVHQPQTQAPVYFPPYATAPGYPYQNIPQSVGFTPMAMPAFPSTQPQSLSYTSSTAECSEHVCHCGDGCQCLGCASHPFNNTTRQHVQEMGLIVGLNGEEQNQHSPYSTNAAPSPLDYSVTAMNHYSGQTHSHHMGNGFSPHLSYASDQFMEPSEYYTLEYPVGLPSSCSDVTGSCQCGNDCSCVGCLTHSGHNGFAFQPVSTEAVSFHASPPAQQSSPRLSRDPSVPSPSL
ncbi:hypothetical protein SI65_07674 [Aspergillus cristatus]|uniref:Copper-fist domain-containing protein n=1 Tax=Aspergillus cristatus TaxID=573508 RepID=A0A1E3B701_ASPCR|nr:hypothetical protein SI65_07674 [Aspergillus cristatus]